MNENWRWDGGESRCLRLRFFFRRTLEAPFSTRLDTLPQVPAPADTTRLSPEEVARLIDAAGNLQARADPYGAVLNRHAAQ